LKALDTNVLVRFLVRDDQAMTAKARRVFEEAQDAGESLVIHNLVLIETLWVLGSAYGFSREAILEAVERLQALAPIRFESHALVRELVSLGRSSTLDLADALIGLHARNLGCDATFTFDRQASKSELFESIE